MARPTRQIAGEVQPPKRGGIANLIPGQGRPKGVPNKMTTQVKEMILAALDKAGGVDYLARQADETPAAFMSLVGKVLPLTLQGNPDQPIAIQQVDEDAHAFRRRLLSGLVAGAAGSGAGETVQ